MQCSLISLLAGLSTLDPSNSSRLRFGPKDICSNISPLSSFFMCLFFLCLTMLDWYSVLNRHPGSGHTNMLSALLVFILRSSIFLASSPSAILTFPSLGYEHARRHL